ncbi:hypothetical protein Tco_0247607 [Tanacetum coccineum]
MEVNIEEDENEPELTYPYEEVDPLNHSADLLLSLKPEAAIEIENPIEYEDKTVPTSCHAAHELVKKKGKAKDEYYGKLILGLGNEVRSSVEQGMAAMEKLVEKLGNAEDKAKCKRIGRMELEEHSLAKHIPSIVFLCDPLKLQTCESGNDAGRSGPARVVELLRWFEKTKSVESKKVKFAAATLQGPALTWWNTKVATMGLEIASKDGSITKRISDARIPIREDAEDRVEPNYGYWSFVDTRFSSMLDIDPVKIGASYEVELADGRDQLSTI